MKISTSIKLIVLGLLLVAVGVCIRLAQVYTDPARLRRLALDAFERNVTGGLSLGTVELRADATLRAGDISITPPGQAAPFFRCERVLAPLDRLHLLRLQAVPTRATVVSPVFNLVYSQEEKAWNFEAIELLAPPELLVRPERLLSDGIILENATLRIQCWDLFQDEEPREYTGLQLAVRPVVGAPDRWRFDGAFLGGALGGARVWGWITTGEQARVKVHLDADALAADREFWTYVPYGRSVWKDFQPEGALSLSATVEFGGAGGPDYTSTWRLRDGKVNTTYYPAPIHSVCGTVDVINDDVVATDCTGEISPRHFGGPRAGPRPVRVRVNGNYPYRRDQCVTRVQAWDVPLCRQSVESIPEAGPELWGRLRPGGRCSLDLTAIYDPETDRSEVTAVSDLDDASVQLRDEKGELLLPLEQVSGRIVWNGRAVRLENVRGVAVQPVPEDGKGDAHRAGIAVDGVYDPEHVAGTLKVSITDLLTNERLFRAVPDCEAAWDRFRPEVRLDAAVTLWDQPDSEQMRYAALVEVHGGRAQAKELPMPVGDLTGRLRVDESEVVVERLTGVLLKEDPIGGGATVRDGTIELSGVIGLATDRYELYVEADHISANEPLVCAIPVVGRQIWTALEPRGAVSVQGKLLYDAAADPDFSCLLDVEMMDVSARFAAVPVPLSAVSGHLLVSETRAISNFLAGAICDGKLEGTVGIRYGPGEQEPGFEATLRLSHTNLPGIIEHLGGGQTHVVGRIDGTCQLRGKLLAQSGLTARGRVSVTDAVVWKMPLFARLLPVLHLGLPGEKGAPGQGEATFELQGDTFTIPGFTFVGGGLNITGQGTVKLDKTLDMTMVAIGAKKGGFRIPIISPVIDWLLHGIESQLFRVKVTGTIDEPVFKSEVISTITAPLTLINNILLRPLFGGEED